MFGCVYTFRKVLLVDLHGQAHINICVALFCGLVTFLSGIETASKYEVTIMYTPVAHRDIYTMIGHLYCSSINLTLLFPGSVLLDVV